MPSATGAPRQRLGKVWAASRAMLQGPCATWRPSGRATQSPLHRIAAVHGGAHSTGVHRRDCPRGRDIVGHRRRVPLKKSGREVKPSVRFTTKITLVLGESRQQFYPASAVGQRHGCRLPHASTKNWDFSIRYRTGRNAQGSIAARGMGPRDPGSAVPLTYGWPAYLALFRAELADMRAAQRLCPLSRAESTLPPSRFALGYAPMFPWDALVSKQPFRRGAGRGPASTSPAWHDIDRAPAVAANARPAFPTVFPRTCVMFPIRIRRGRVIGFGGRIILDRPGQY